MQEPADSAPGASDPRIRDWRRTTRTYRAEWTGRGQGVATDGVSWFVSRNDASPGISRYSADFSTLEARVEIPRSEAGHVGAIAIFDGVLHCALESPELAVSYTLDLEPVDRVAIDRPVESDLKRHLAWCAVNPANRLLYTCNWVDAIRLDAYDPSTGAARPDADIALASSVNRVQGGDFGPAGNVYLASDDRLSFAEWLRSLLPFGGATRRVFPGVHGFSASTGAGLGFFEIPTRPHLPQFEEVEGIGLGPMMVDGERHDVHVAVLDKNHSWVRDDVDLVSFAVPDPDSL